MAFFDYYWQIKTRQLSNYEIQPCHLLEFPRWYLLEIPMLILGNFLLAKQKTSNKTEKESTKKRTWFLPHHFHEFFLRSWTRWWFQFFLAFSPLFGGLWSILTTPPKFNIAPEKWWLEGDPFLLGPGNFSGAKMLNFGRVIFFNWLGWNHQVFMKFSQRPSQKTMLQLPNCGWSVPQWSRSRTFMKHPIEPRKKKRPDTFCYTGCLIGILISWFMKQSPI